MLAMLRLHGYRMTPTSFDEMIEGFLPQVDMDLLHNLNHAFPFSCRFATNVHLMTVLVIEYYRTNNRIYLCHTFSQRQECQVRPNSAVGLGRADSVLPEVTHSLEIVVDIP
jgi:hypothetical protein